MRIAVFGLGEAGSRIAADLARAGADVHGFDPAPVPTPDGVIRHQEPVAAVGGAAIIMAITAAADAQTAIAQAWDRLPRNGLYADLSTAPPTLKEDLNDTASLRGLRFADVALMAPVPGKGLATPAFVSGSGAESFAADVNRLGGNVTYIGDEPGDAAARKLLRSVVVKSLAAAVIEAMDAAEELNLDKWLWDHLGEQFAEADRHLISGIAEGTVLHAERRIVEMESASALLESVGIEPSMSRAAAEVMRRVQRGDHTDGVWAGRRSADDPSLEGA